MVWSHIFPTAITVKYEKTPANLFSNNFYNTLKHLPKNKKNNGRIGACQSLHLKINSLHKSVKTIPVSYYIINTI